jgi:hypothetical protein
MSPAQCWLMDGFTPQMAEAGNKSLLACIRIFFLYGARLFFSNI